MQKLITTSWDDGHPLDFKLADLLAKYNLPATFYIPQSNAEREVMQASAIRQLAEEFEVGGHTLHHTRLNSQSDNLLNEEIGGSYNWLLDITGKAPVSFCFPGGVYNQRSLNAVFGHGYKLARDTELLRTETKSSNGTTPTTVQVYEHSRMTYLKHTAKYRRWANLLQWFNPSRQTALAALAESFLQKIEKEGGCFHLWGHSWEIEQYNLWSRLEEIFRIIANRPGFQYVENRGLINPQML